MADRTSRLRLIIDSSDAREAARDLDRFGDEADRAGRETDELKRKTDGAGRAMRGFAGALKTLVAGLAIREVLQMADAFQAAQNRLRLVTSSTQELISVQEELQAIAARTFSTFQGSADLYSRLALSTEELGVSSQRLLGITETINQAVALSGTSAQAANAALFQLGQGLGAGALRGEELNSILEQTPELARAIAEGLGVSIGEIRQLGAEGALTAERVLGALENQADTVRDKFNTLEPTIGQVATVIREAFSNALAESFVDELAEGGVKALALRDAFAELGEIIGSAFALAIEKLIQFGELVEEVTFQLEKLGLLKIDIEFDPQSVEQVRQALFDVNTQIKAIENQLTDGKSFAFSLAREGLIGPDDPRRAGAEAQLAELRATAEELTAILTNSVTPAADDLTVSLSDIRDGLQKVEDPITDLGDAAKEAAEKLKGLDETSSRRGSFAQGLGSDATTIQEFDRRIAPLFSDDAAAQLAEEIGVSFEEAQRRLRIEEDQAREQFLDRQADSFEKLPSTIKSGVEEGSRRGVEVGFAQYLRDRGAPTIEIVGEGFNIGEDLFDNLSRAFEPFTSGLKKSFESVVSGIGEIGKSIGEGLKDLGGFLGGAFGGLLGNIGGIFGGIGQTAGFIGSVIDFFGGLFGRKTAKGTVDLTTGDISGLKDSKKEDGARNDRRDAVLEGVVTFAQQIAELTGASITSGISLQVEAGKKDIQSFIVDSAGRTIASSGKVEKDDVEGALTEAVKLVLDRAFSGGDEALTNFVRAAVDAGQDIQDVIPVLKSLSAAVSTGRQELIDYAFAAASAGHSAESIAQGIDALDRALALGEEPLSSVEQALKQIADATDPVIADLAALGQSIEGVQNAANAAREALGDAFVRDIENDILSFRNAVLGEFERLLDSQEKLVKDAQALLDAGAISPAEFDLVQVRNALERQNFFEGLSPEELEGLGDFLGIIEQSGGSVAVILTQLTDAFADFTDNVAETRDRLQKEADQLAGYADAIFRTRDRIDLRFPSQSGGELLGDLRGQLANLREQALAGDNTAFEKIPDLANRLVDLAREIFGATTDFAKERDFALQVLDQTGSLAESRSDKLLTEIEALNSQVDVLNDIRDVLESPDPAIEYIQAQLNQNTITNDLLRQLLEQYIALTAEARSGSVAAAQIQSGAEDFLSAGSSTAGITQVEVARQDEVIVLLASVRDAIRVMNTTTTSALQDIRNEQRRSTVNATLTG